MKPHSHSTLLHTTIACICIGITLSILGGALGLFGKFLSTLPLMTLFGTIIRIVGALARIAASLTFCVWFHHYVAAWFGWWRIGCKLGTKGKRWATRTYLDGGGRWGVGVDMFGLQLDVYAVAGE